MSFLGLARAEIFNKVDLKGERKHPILVSSNKMSKTQVASLTKYYSTLEVKNTDLEQIRITPSGLSTHSPTQLIKQGQSIYSPCSGCHGMEAEGIGPYPRLADQQHDYLKQQLTHFKTGLRKNKIMQIMTVNLSEEDINALAFYLSTLNEMKLQNQNMSQQ